MLSTQPTPGCLVRTRWLRSYSAIFSISSFIFSIFCLRRSSHSWGGGGDSKHMAVRKNHKTSYTGKTGQPKFPKDRQVTKGA